MNKNFANWREFTKNNLTKLAVKVQNYTFLFKIIKNRAQNLYFFDEFLLFDVEKFHKVQF